MTEDIEKGNFGSPFEDFLEEQGRDEDTTDQAIKRAQAFQLSEERGSVE